MKGNSVKKRTAIFLVPVLIIALSGGRLPAGTVAAEGAAKDTAIVVTTTDDLVDPDDGKTSLREALAAARDGDVITFDEALFGQGGKQPITIRLAGSELIYGGSSDLETDKAVTIRGRTDPKGLPLVTVSGDGKSRVLHNDGDGKLTIYGLEIKDGYMDGGDGGGIYSCGDVTAENCNFVGNFASKGGGGISVSYTNSRQADLTNCLFDANIAGTGGGISVYSLTATGCIFKDNISNGDIGSGGGIDTQKCILESCMFIDNAVKGTQQVQAAGGGVAFSEELIAVNCTFTGNTASVGAGIYAGRMNATATIIDCLFDNNTGSAIRTLGSYTVANSSFTNNVAARVIDKISSQPGYLYHCTVAGNTGNGINGDAYLYNCIVAGNAGQQISGSSLGTGSNIVTNDYKDAFGNNVVMQDWPGLLPLDIMKTADVLDVLDNTIATAAYINRDELFDALKTDVAGNQRDSGNTGKCTYGAVEATARTWVVENENDSGSGSLRQAVAEANANNEADNRVILFDDMVADIAITSSIEISKELMVYGRTDGRNEPDITITSNGLSGIFNYSQDPGELMLYGLHIKDGNDGSGIKSDSGSITAENCAFTNNSTAAGNSGGAISAKQNITVINSTFTNNTAGNTGGAVYSQGGIIEVTACTFTDNKAGEGIGSSGGAVYSGGAAKVMDSVFTNNTAWSGSGLYAADAVTAVNSTFTANTGDQGSGVYAGKDIRLFHTTVAVNDSINAGQGSVFSDSGSLYLYNSIITGNNGAQTNKTSAGGSSLVEEIDDVIHETVFGQNGTEAGGYLKVLGSGMADSTATALNDGDLAAAGIMDAGERQSLLSALANDLAGSSRPAAGNVSYGALETPEDSIAAIAVEDDPSKTTFELGEAVDMDGFSDGTIKITYDSGKSGVVATSAPVASSSLDTSTAGDKTIILTYLNKTCNLAVSVKRGTPALTLTSSENPSEFSQSITFNVAVTGVLNAVKPSGTVKLYDGDIELDERPIEGSTVKFETDGLPGGKRNIRVLYSGDNNYTEVNSAVYQQQVNKKPQEELNITGILSPLTYGDPSFKVSGVGGNGTGKIAWESSDTAIADIDQNGWVTINGAGETDITVTKADDGNYLEKSKTIKLIIDPKSVTITGLAAKDKSYDGTLTAVFDTSKATIEGKLAKDEVAIGSGTAAFSDKEAGSGKDVFFTGFTLTGAQAANYSLAGQPAAGKADILKKELRVLVMIEEKPYDGLPYAVIKSADLAYLIPGDDVQLENGIAIFNQTAVGSNIPVSFTSPFAITGNDANNYNLIQPIGITGTIKEGFIPTAGTHYTLSSPDGENGWHCLDDFVITAENGYEISQDNKDDSQWEDKLVFTEEIADGRITFYIRNTATNEISVAKTEQYQIDKTSPEAEITMKSNSFKTFMNFITFKLFFKNTVDVKVEAADAISGIAQIEYQTVEAAEQYSPDKGWISGDSFSVTNSQSFSVYARVTDNAGNITIINSEGTVVYQDSEQDTKWITYTKTFDTDLTAKVKLNGNTVAAIRNGAELLVMGTDYTADNSTGVITFKAAYLDSLTVGEYTLAISYHPQGREYTEQEDNEAPAETTIGLQVNRAGQNGIHITGMPQSLTYGDQPFMLTILGNSSSGEVKWASSNENAATVSQNGTVTITGAGNTEITALIAADDTYEVVQADLTLTIKKAEQRDIVITEGDLSCELAEQGIQLTFTGGSGTGEITWNSKDTSVATVDKQGYVTFVKKGSTIITINKAADDNHTSPVQHSVVLTIVDKGELTRVIEAATRLKDNAVVGQGHGEYPQGALDLLDGAIVDAKAVKNNPDATQEMIDDAVIKLQQAIDVFRLSQNIIDASALTALIATAENKLEQASFGERNGDYAPDQEQALKEAIDKARIVADKLNHTAEELKAAVNALNTAIAAFNRALVIVDYQLLEDLISRCLAIYEDAVEGDGSGEYEPGSKEELNAAIQAAQAAAGNHRATQAEVDKARTELQASLELFASKISGINYDILNALILQAEEKLAGSSYGDRNGEYPLSAKAALEAAIKAAKLVAGNADLLQQQRMGISQEQVDEAARELQTAITAFNNSIIVVNYQNLTDLIEMARHVRNAATEGQGEGQYPASAVKVLEAAIQAAQSVADDNYLSQKTVDEAYDVLNREIDLFFAARIVVDRTMLENAVSEAEKVLQNAEAGSNAGQYPQTAVDQLQSAVDEAIVVLNHPNASQEEVDKAALDLLAALEIFRKSVNAEQPGPEKPNPEKPIPEKEDGNKPDTKKPASKQPGVPRVKKAAAPDTGDDKELLRLILALLLSAGTAGIVFKKRRRRG